MTLIVVAAAAFGLGLYGVLTRRDIVGVLASIEVMMGGALLLLVALGTTAPVPSRTQGVGLVILVVAAAEAAIGLALLVAVARRRKTTRIDELTEVRG